MLVQAEQPIVIAEVEINELNSLYIEGDVVDQEGDPVPSAAVSAFAIDLYDDKTGTVINGRDEQSIFNVNGGTYHPTSGHFTFTFESEDNPIIGSYRRGYREPHTARFTLTWGSSGRWDGEVRLYVGNMTRVP